MDAWFGKNMKVILDTNVLIDATNDDFSRTWKIIDLVLQGKIQAFASEKILREYKLIIHCATITKSCPYQFIMTLSPSNYFYIFTIRVITFSE